MHQLDQLQHNIQYPFRNGYYKYFIHDNMTVLGPQNFKGMLLLALVCVRYRPSGSGRLLSASACALMGYLVNFHFYLYYRLAPLIDIAVLLLLQFAL